MHTDHLGSVIYATHDGGTPPTDQRYYPYGRKRSGGTLPTDHRFTGQKLDGTGLYYYNARYYDPELGTFISPDTIVPDPSNVFDWNRYMYTRGNPLKYTDPSGNIIRCPFCSQPNGEPAVMLDYSDTSGFANTTVDLAATTYCFFAGCHVDRQNDVVTGPTAEEQVDLMNSYAMGMINPIGMVYMPAAGLLDDGLTRLLRVKGDFGTRFANYSRVLELGRSLGSKIDYHHWIPQQFHDEITRRWGSLSDDLLHFTEPLDDGFHSWLHGQGAKGNLQDAYNGQISQWLEQHETATLDEFLREVKRVRDRYLNLYEQYILEQP